MRNNISLAILESRNAIRTSKSWQKVTEANLNTLPLAKDGRDILSFSENKNFSGANPFNMFKSMNS